MAKINLRKSAAIQKELQSRIACIDVDTTVDINEFTKPQDAVAERLQEAIDNIQLRTHLLTTLYSMRAKTAQVNAKCGVTALLAEEARLQHEISMYTELSRTKVRRNFIEVEGRLEKIRKAEDSQFRDTITVSLFDREQVSTFKETVKALKKSKQQANDKLLELNVKKSIELTTEEEQILSNEGLI